MSAVESEKKAEEEKTAKCGEILFCGATNWDQVGKKKGPNDTYLVSPTRLRPLLGINIRFVASGCTSCHCVALDVEGRCYTWGRNDKGQLGHGDTIQRDRPTVVSGLSKYNIVTASSGRSHTVVVTDDGTSLSFGWNKHGQLGAGSVKNELELSPVRCLVSDVKTASCGADFTVWLSSVQGASILTAGLPQYGQLGHGSDNEYNTKDSQPRPKAVASLSQETIVKVACGTNHTVAVDSNGYVYTWGYGGYGRLGHREQKDEWSPRRIDVFTRHNVLPPNSVVSAGSVNSSCTAAGGQLFMWGKLNIIGDDWMYPKPLLNLRGWNIRCMDSGSMHHFVGADSSCISWGVARELGHGPLGQKYSEVPKKVDSLEGMHVMSVACGYAHSIVVVDRTEAGERLDQLDVYDGKAAGEGNVVPENIASASCDVERLVTSIEKDSGKELHIEKGCGTALKDIRNGLIHCKEATKKRKRVTEAVEEKSPIPKKSTFKDIAGKKVLKGKEKKPKGEKLEPSDTELKNATCEILKEVDCKTATVMDILKLLVKRFNTDLVPRKSTVRCIILDELTKMF